MTRVCILLLDSFGIGALKDAEKFGDSGANTFLHIAEKTPSLALPNLAKFGLYHAAKACSGIAAPQFREDIEIEAAYGYASEIGYGKDTIGGHWEIAGIPVLFEWGYFPKTQPCFPERLISDFVSQAKLPGILGNKHASGTEIIAELGEESVRTGKPIVYTSADSVFQIAAHEETFGLKRLYEICEIARKLVNDYHVGRVIARPFIGSADAYKRTANRKDYAVPPFAPTLLDKLVASGGEVISIGKIADIFSYQGISKTVKAFGNAALFNATLEQMNLAKDRSLVFTNFIDFDMEYGHRRDIRGYAKALEAFDASLPELEKQLQPEDIVVITADHGCDPTYKGTDHTREYIPILIFGKKIKSGFIGDRETFSDIAQTLAEYFSLEKFPHGKSFLSLLY